jgi:hypothetical protein
VNSVFASYSTVAGQLNAGTVRALATGSRTRIEPLPDVPTVACSRAAQPPQKPADARFRRCACRAKRADRGIHRNGAGDAGESDGPTRAEAMPIEIRRGWLRSLVAREADLLPVPYFHVVFTLPAAIADMRPTQPRPQRLSAT